MGYKKVPKGSTVEKYIGLFDKTTQDMTKELRKLVRKVAPNLVEEIKWGVPWYTGNKEVIHIMAHKDHVNLGIMHATKLKDPKGLLEGSGKSLRHVKVFN